MRYVPEVEKFFSIISVFKFWSQLTFIQLALILKLNFKN